MPRTRCPNCGSDVVNERAVYCDRCGAVLSSPFQSGVGQPVAPVITKKTPKGMSLILLGLVFVVVGIVLSTVSFLLSVNEITHWQWDPWNDSGEMPSHWSGFGLMTLVADIFMAVGGGLFVIGLIWLVIEE